MTPIDPGIYKMRNGLTATVTSISRRVPCTDKTTGAHGFVDIAWGVDSLNNMHMWDVATGTRPPCAEDETTPLDLIERISE